MIPQASLRVGDGNPYLYLETDNGSSAFGTVAGSPDVVNLVVSDAATNITPNSGTPSISISTGNPGNISFQPIGIGESNFVTGDVNIEAGNLDLVNTTAGGAAGVINLGGSRFVHNYSMGNGTFVGMNSGNFGNTGVSDTGIGAESLASLTNGGNNVSIGAFSCAQLTSGNDNVCVGTASLTNAIGCNENVAVGVASLIALTNGTNNISVGYSSGSLYSSSESSNITIGNTGVISESNVIRIGSPGSSVGQQNACFIAGIEGTSVTPVGTVVINSSGQLGTSSSLPVTVPVTVANGGTGLTTITAHSVMVGEGTSNVTPIAVATNGQVLLGSTGADPVFATLTSTGSTITFTPGAGTLNLEAAGGSTNNLALPDTNSGGTVGVISYGGTSFLHDYDPNNLSIFLGKGAGNFSNTATTGNIGIGQLALSSLGTGTDNIAIGNGALQDEITGNHNIAIGATVLASTSGTASSNIGIGTNTLSNLASGNNNLAIGTGALLGITGPSASFNTVIGTSAGSNYGGSEASNILIVNPGVAAETNVIRIGTQGSSGGQQNACFIAGISGVTSAGATAVVINSSGQLGTVISSIRYKENVEDMGEVSSAIFDLRPVTFNFKADETHAQQVGLIAEEVNDVMPNLVVRSTDGEIETVKYHELVPMLLNELIKLNKRIESLEAR